ncbi:ThuA domain-containing protein [Microbacterium sp. F51-2R]|uniref:ThuA domain-containing protein n=1 Tax=Microbacterium sp. F51-2R TaxID=3445777 RepID=UPI003F9F00A0
MRAVIASGSERYDDPWHPFERTSPLVAGILTDAGFEVSIDHAVDHAMTRLDDVDLLVVNAGDPWRGSPRGAEAGADAVAGMASALDRGIGVIALHCAVSSLRDYPEWFGAIGGMWVPGLSFHPPAGVAHIFGGRLPDGTQIESFDVFDECYCRIQQIGRSTPVAHHHADGQAEPVAWTRTHGRSRIAVDLLGHDERSYESEGHAHLLSSLARWTVGAPPTER